MSRGKPLFLPGVHKKLCYQRYIAIEEFSLYLRQATDTIVSYLQAELDELIKTDILLSDSGRLRIKDDYFHIQ